MVDTSKKAVEHMIGCCDLLGQKGSADMLRALQARCEAAEAEVEHWVGRYNELEAWRAQTSVLHLKAEAEVERLKATAVSPRVAP